MPFCGHCGNKLSDYDIYCTYCGTRVEQPEAEDTSMRGVVMFQRESSFSSSSARCSRSAHITEAESFIYTSKVCPGKMQTGFLSVEKYRVWAVGL